MSDFLQKTGFNLLNYFLMSSCEKSDEMIKSSLITLLELAVKNLAQATTMCSVFVLFIL